MGRRQKKEKERKGGGRGEREGRSMAPPTHTSIVPYIFLSGDVHIVRVFTDTRFDHYLTVFNVLQEKEKGGRIEERKVTA